MREGNDTVPGAENDTVRDEIVASLVEEEAILAEIDNYRRPRMEKLKKLRLTRKAKLLNHAQMLLRL